MANTSVLLQSFSDEEVPVLSPPLDDGMGGLFFAASPSKEDSSAASVTEPSSSYDLFASRQPRTQDLFPEGVLQEQEPSSPAVSPPHVSIFPAAMPYIFFKKIFVV